LLISAASLSPRSGRFVGCWVDKLGHTKANPRHRGKRRQPKSQRRQKPSIRGKERQDCHNGWPQVSQDVSGDDSDRRRTKVHPTVVKHRCLFEVAVPSRWILNFREVHRKSRLTLLAHMGGCAMCGRPSAAGGAPMHHLSIAHLGLRLTRGRRGRLRIILGLGAAARATTLLGSARSAAVRRSLRLLVRALSTPVAGLTAGVAHTLRLLIGLRLDQGQDGRFGHDSVGGSKTPRRRL
jgi:hypothetical protein